MKHTQTAKAIVALQQGPTTTQQLVQATGVAFQTAQRFVRAMRKAGAIHITGWDKDVHGRDMIPLFQLGHGADTPRHRLTNAQRQANWRARKKEIV